MVNVMLRESSFNFFLKAVKFARKEKEEEEMEKAAWQASGHSRERKVDSAVCAPKLPTPGPSAAPSSVPPPQSRLSLSPRPLGPSTQAGSEPEPSCTTGPGHGQVSIEDALPPKPALSTRRSRSREALWRTCSRSVRAWSLHAGPMGGCTGCGFGGKPVSLGSG